MKRKIKRNVKRIIKFVLITFFTAFFNSLMVSAISNGEIYYAGSDIYFNNRLLTNDGGWFGLDAGNISVKIEPRFGFGNVHNVWPYIIHYKLNFCSDSNYNSWSGLTARGSGTSGVYSVNINNSSTKCSYNGSSYTGGRIIEIIFSFQAYSSSPYTFNINQTGASSVQFISLQSSVGENLFSFEYNSVDINSQQIDETNEKLDEQNQKIEEQTEAINNQTQQQHEDAQHTQETITSTDVTGANNQSASFFDNFQNNDHGLSGIITAPLSMIQSITSSTCSPLRIPVAFVNQTIELPCMSTIYQTHFSSFLTLYQTITFGLVSYWVCINIFGMVKGFKDPEQDRIEVLDL